MQRRLFDFYHRHLTGLAGWVPSGVRGAVAGRLYRASRHPDFGFAHARSLMARGQAAKAAKLYGGPVTDPLFAAGLEPHGPLTSPADGVVLAQLSYLGLRLSGELRHTGPTPPPDHITLELDGTVLRPERLHFKEGRAAFRAIIARPVLDRFPPQSLLQVRLPDGRLLPAPKGRAGWRLTLPHATGGIMDDIAHHGPLEKKGHLRPDAEAITARQTAYLALYTELREVFARDFHRPLLILYGTLLGQVRSRDFIPGDDDFDVGYPSALTTPEQVRAEAIEMMIHLAKLGYVIVLNETGRPFRIRARDGAAWCHLDNRPVFSPDGRNVWLHKHACLPLPLSAFEKGEASLMRGSEVLRPTDPNAFLAAYYGENWRVPDPGYSNTGRHLPDVAKAGLAALCLTPQEQRDLADRYPGHIVPVRWQPLYPLADYAARVGF